MERNEPSGAPTPIGVGTRLAETYELTRLIGRGGMGAVWEAVHLRLPKRVAVKLLHEDAKSADPDAFERFRREAEITSRLGHPHIVEVFDFNTLPDGTPYIVLELLHGEGLGARLARGPLGVDQAIAVTRQIGSALEAAHRQGVVHRDLKPDNVFLCRPDSDPEAAASLVKVLDFGISKIRGLDSVKTRKSVLIGTPRHMAPEQVTGVAELDGRCDEFALATIVFEMISGRPLFTGDMTEVLYKVVHAPLPRLAAELPGAPATLVGALERALQRDPARRFPDVASFVAALAGERSALPSGADTRIARVRPEKGPRPSAGASTDAGREPLRRSRRRQFVAALALGVVAAVLVLARTWQLEGSRSAGASDAAPMGAFPLQAASPDAGPPDGTPLDVPPADAGSPSAAAPDAGPADAGSADAGRPPTKPPLRPEPKLPPEIEAQLVDAEAAVSHADFETAERLAKRTIGYANTSRAYSVLTRVACSRRDLSQANAWMRNVSAPGDRKRTFAACRKLGLDLPDAP